MRLYTIQARPVWDRWQETGVLCADPAWIQPYFVPAYHWMRQQMEIRIGPPPREDLFPVWAWFQWHNEARPKPDLRFNTHLPSGTAGVCVTIEVPAASVLLSDFDLWHYVLNNWYLGHSLSDIDMFEARQNSHTSVDDNPSDPDAQKQASWLRIFDLDWHADEIAVPRPSKSIQAVSWQFPLESVKSVRLFTAR